MVKGINLLNAVYHSNGGSIAVAFELVKKPIQYCDIATKKPRRKGERTKNEIMREMIATCIRNDLKFRFIFMDSWFSLEENYDFITQRYPLRSYGFGIRLNLFNFALLRWDYSIPRDGSLNRGYWFWTLGQSF